MVEPEEHLGLPYLEVLDPGLCADGRGAGRAVRRLRTEREPEAFVAEDEIFEGRPVRVPFLSDPGRFKHTGVAQLLGHHLDLDSMLRYCLL